MSFAGKVVIVTGASGGIGRATAVKFGSLGASVALFGRNKAKLKETENAVKYAAAAGSGKIAAFPFDVSSEVQVDQHVAEATAYFGYQLDVLVNNAGVLVGSPTQTTSTETFDKNFEVNTRGTFLMMKACIPHLKATKGSIVNVSSVTGMQSFGNSMAYCASKAAVDMMTKCAALDLAADGIRVNSINPGVVRSELQKTGGLSNEAYAAFLERSKLTHPLGRIGEPEEAAELIAFLADNSKAGFVTGAILPMDGGRACLGAR